MRRFVMGATTATAVLAAVALGTIGVAYAITPGEHSVELRAVEPIVAQQTGTTRPDAAVPSAADPSGAGASDGTVADAPVPDAPGPAPSTAPAPQPVAPGSPVPAPSADSAAPVEVAPQQPHTVGDRGDVWGSGRGDDDSGRDDDRDGDDEGRGGDAQDGDVQDGDAWGDDRRGDDGRGDDHRGDDPGSDDDGSADRWGDGRDRSSGGDTDDTDGRR